MTQTPAGWHRDQQNPNQERYWDGTQWTDQYRPAVPVAPQMPVQYVQAPVKKSHTARNVILGIIGVTVLFVGGCIALIGGAANEVSKSIEDDANKAGGTDNPLTIVEGQAFEVDGFNYAAGWSVRKDVLGDIEIRGLKVTNNRDDRDSAIVEIKFHRGTEVLASADCTTEPIQKGSTVTLGCFSADKLPKSYEKITINDSF